MEGVPSSPLLFEPMMPVCLMVFACSFDIVFDFLEYAGHVLLELDFGLLFALEVYG